MVIWVDLACPEKWDLWSRKHNGRPGKEEDMYVKIDLNPEQTARLYALQVSEENRDPAGNPYFRITKAGSRPGNKDKVEISIMEFVSTDRKSAENRLSMDEEHDHSASKEKPEKGEPIPGSLLLKIFNAIGRFPFTPPLAIPGPRFEISKFLLSYAAFIYDCTHTDDWLNNQRAYELTRGLIKGEVNPDEFIKHYVTTTGLDKKPADRFVENIERIMMDENEPAPVVANGISPMVINDVLCIINEIEDRTERIHALTSLSTVFDLATAGNPWTMDDLRRQFSSLHMKHHPTHDQKGAERAHKLADLLYPELKRMRSETPSEPKANQQ